MARYETIPNAARIIGNHPRTWHNWLRRRYIHAFDDGSGEIRVDLDEVEAAFHLHPQMRDPRKRYGGRGNVVRVVPPAPTSGADQ